MKKKIIGIFVFILLIGSVFPVTGNVLIDKTPLTFVDGNILYVGGSGEGNYTRIQDAINDSLDGDTVFVYDDSSPYFESLMITKSINLIGENKDTTIIDSGGNGNVVSIKSNEVEISDFTIQNSGISSDDKGIEISYRYSDINVTNNKIFHNRMGMYINDSWNVLIKGNNISFNEHGIWNYHSTITVTDNIISNNLWDGINAFCNENVITNNIISGNLSDTYVDDGIEIGGNNNIISGNTITQSDHAIDMQWSNNNKIIGNNICSNDEFMFLANSNSNIISQNNFIDNKCNEIPIPCFINSFFNKWQNNFWDRGRLLPYPILGMILLFNDEILIPWINFDWHPASEPYDIEI